MRLPDSPMTPAEFEEALDAARNGEIQDDDGAPQPVSDALDLVARNPSIENILSARTVFRTLTS